MVMINLTSLIPKSVKLNLLIKKVTILIFLRILKIICNPFLMLMNLVISLIILLKIRKILAFLLLMVYLLLLSLFLTQPRKLLIVNLLRKVK